ncbi:MAG: hypothetical protein A2857_00885 [Candidatus Levybacteria bacterium RIFCSPHIGHO2_01_FULL_36_15]|nr:MAG: hypothetical protein A2857_00885 [Candidatus Levybacteria bacterium RIFCSPHIGHO2_01_FULL_36_15]OGH39113.1 MAG: hypothetical protein A2905_06490 [Candidatus Levybacteria bacterium RIFCSPLOWO2_01_FULL_36_10]
MKIGFDFDKVFVDYPPLIPNFIIDKLYKKKNHNLVYRFPGNLEKKLRILSHTSIFRSPIKNNIKALSKISANKNLDVYLISGRFGFLKEKTNQWFVKHKIDKYFKKIFFNFNNEQPHIFKDRIIKNLGVEKYIDDDLDLLIHLATNNPKIKFFWLSNKIFSKHIQIPKNIFPIKDIKQFIEKHL